MKITKAKKNNRSFPRKLSCRLMYVCMYVCECLFNGAVVNFISFNVTRDLPVKLHAYRKQ